ncbi:hypothetical protein BC1002_0146 [Paraburkholderia atlantica]|uniref:Replication initiation protein n=1 Tax=Paraburkholderia atlantica TaxID=2654982 RepID=D5WA32_PARAM|nr:hypothetical protein [Paraburkholderia atlantica]ADG14254.1 hypothetical protein BC1002_0146 [Paraburkholderia atlantica]
MTADRDFSSDTETASPIVEQAPRKSAGISTNASRPHDTVSFDYGRENPPQASATNPTESTCAINYNHLRFRAEVDWIEIEIKTISRTNFPTVQRALNSALQLPDSRNVFVKALDEGPGKAASVFRFRLQDPNSWSFVASMLKQLERRFPFASEPKITAIEIAFDAYSRTESKMELADQAARFFKFCTLIVSKNCRIYRDFGGSPDSIPFQRASLVRHLWDGWQIGIGNKHDDRLQHIYVKTTDGNGAPLPSAKHRARIEITLRGAALPYQGISEWAGADFEKDLRMSAKFRMLKPKLNRFTRAAIEKTTFQVGERKRRWRVTKDRTAVSGERLHSATTIADRHLNEKARDAFRELSRRWR